MRIKKTTLTWVIALLVVGSSMTLFTMVFADPEGGTVTFVSNSTKNSSAPDSRQDSKGTITVVTLATVQQNIKWKAYVGNVSGTLVLRDAEDFAIYQWPSGGSPDGEVYMTRNDSIDWSTIQCANATSISAEDTALGHLSSATDNINATFANTIHESIDIGIITITNSTCRSIVTYVNDTAQTQTENALFQEVVLQDNAAHVVFASLINQDTSGYKVNNDTYDFQGIVPDFTGASTATYYFYVEISG